ncbi:putative uncharacterized protein [Waddlia chondrophila 2032/99]|uniref:Uncharacterized protein n=1 Tax=Waddlia chondrophila 2032/99 TaxID=765953 RepID=F8LBP8_9BACT|nr:putative uncharacterized protein [Waddlia chondrophila 2032/99]
MTSTGGIPPDGGSIHWQSSSTSGSDETERTTRAATFKADGKEYTVKVSYSRQAVKEKYGISDDAVDATMEEVISKIGVEQLKNLAGHSISASLRGKGGEQIQYKANKDSNYQIFSDALKTKNLPLFQTISTVRTVFQLNTGALRQVPSSSGELELTSIRFEEVPNEVFAFIEHLSSTNPIASDLGKIKKIIEADSADEVKKILEDSELKLTKEQQNEVLKQLKDVDFADEIRVAIGLQKEGDVFLDVSQGGIQIENQPEGVGKMACASICGEAILWMESNNEYLVTREDFEQVIKDGIDRHVGGKIVENPPGGKEFNDVFKGISGDFESEDHEFEHSLIAEHFDGEVESMTSSDYLVVTGHSSAWGEELGSILLFKVGDDESSAQWGVMDSHGVTENKGTRDEITRGASLRFFDTAQKALDYVKGHVKMGKEDPARVDKVSVVNRQS